MLSGGGGERRGEDEDEDEDEEGEKEGAACGSFCTPEPLGIAASRLAGQSATNVYPQESGQRARAARKKVSSRAQLACALICSTTNAPCGSAPCLIPREGGRGGEGEVEEVCSDAS